MIDDNKLPSQFQIGDKVATFENGTVVGVKFTEGKVYYEVEYRTKFGNGFDDKYRVLRDSCEVTAEITQRTVNN